MKKRRVLSVFLASVFLLPIFPTLPLLRAGADAEFETRKTPLMGWASWNAYRTDISDEIILSQARKLVELGLADLGYTFVNVDDGWQYGRGEDGFVRTNPDKFPEGMQKLAEDIHALGLNAGIYTDAGEKTCGWVSDNQTTNFDVGLYGHDESDLRRYFIDWGYDFIKVDWCGGVQAGLNARTRYTEIGKVINKIEKEIGKDKIYNVCCWSFPGEWVVNVADSWRTGGDIFNTFNAVLEQIDNIKSLAKYTGPGHVNDLDMMQIGNGMSYEEDKSHFSLWCMMSTPLMLGMDLNSISAETLSIVSNKELIDLDQDPACLQAKVAATYGQIEVWAKDLGRAKSNEKAFALLNRSDKEQTLTVRFEDVGLKGVTAIRDLWSHTDISTDGTLRVTIPAHGTVVLRATGEHVDVAGADRSIPTADDGSKILGEAAFEVAAKSKTVNLTKLGSYDWIHTGNQITRMKDGSGEISYGCEGSFCTYGNAAARYTWTNGDDPVRGANDTSGIGVLGSGAYIYVSVPCDRNERTLTATFGSYSADMEIELIVGGKSLNKEKVPGGANQKADRQVTATFRSDIPTTAYLVARVTKSLGSSDSVNLEGAALKIKVSENAMSAAKYDFSDGAPTLTVPVASAEEDAQLIVTLRGENDEPLKIKSLPVKKGAGRYAFDASLLAGFSGKVDVYFWKDNRPLTAAQTLNVTAKTFSDHSVGMMSAKELVRQGAVLLDVRTPAEYEAGHIEGALNLDYSRVVDEAQTLFPDKETPIIVYCAAARRSAQALQRFLDLGYTKVYNLGSMQNYYVQPTVVFSGGTCEVLTSGEKVSVNYTCDAYDHPLISVSVGKDSTFEDAVPLEDFTVPETDAYYLTLKAYLSCGGTCYASCEHRFIYWSENTVDAFATDLPWTKATVGWGEIRRDRSVENHPLRLAGKVFTHGIGTHANSEISMEIPDGAKKFVAVAGCDNEITGSYTMMFFVKIDGVTVDHSSLIKSGQHYVFDVDIPAGAREILLYAFEGTYGGNTCDHADWCVSGFVNDAKDV